MAKKYTRKLEPIKEAEQLAAAIEDAGAGFIGLYMAEFIESFECFDTNIPSFSNPAKCEEAANRLDILQASLSPLGIGFTQTSKEATAELECRETRPRRIGLEEHK